jgi:antitoxin MazE
MTAAIVRRWGNSLALRIPRDIAAALGIDESTEVQLDVKDGRLVVVPTRTPEYSLEDMLSKCKPSHFRQSAEETQWLTEGPVGKEAL